MLRVHVLYEHDQDLRPRGAAYVRWLLPLRHPANHGHFQVTAGPAYVEGAQVVIVDRLWRPAAPSLTEVEALVCQVRREGATLIYGLDDNVLDWPGDQEGGLGLTPLQARIVRYLAREADGMIVSTEALRERFQCFNPCIEVVPNALDERLFGFSPPGADLPASRARQVIGFMGTYSHDADMMMVLQALRAVFSRRPGRLELHLVGGIAQAAVVQTLSRAPVQVVPLSAPTDAYPAFVPWMARVLHWDLAIAPLEDTPFTRCKSDIKFLDYSLLGIPGIYSRVRPYASAVRHLETGWLVDNTPEAWAAALDQLLEDAVLRARLSQAAYSAVRPARILRSCAVHWRIAILKIVASKRRPQC